MATIKAVKAPKDQTTKVVKPKVTKAVVAPVTEVKQEVKKVN
jgi:hypothetical protein